MILSMHGHEITFSTPFGDIAAKRYGNEKGQKILMLHGWLDNLLSMEPLALELPHYDIVAMDLPGHGHSEHRSNGFFYPFVEFLGVVDAALQILNWPLSHLVSHSLGGAISLAYAATFPAKVLSVVTIDALGPFSSTPDDTVPRLKSFLEEAIRFQNRQVPIYHDQELALKARLKVTPIAEEPARKMVRRNLKAVPGGFTWRSDPRLKLPVPQYFSEEQVHGFLKKVACPVLLVQAKDGISDRLAHLEERKKCMKSLKIVLVPGKHHLHLDSPSEAAKPINEFLKA